MRNKKKETQVLCPKCGTEFAIAKNEFTTVATVIGQDSGLRVIFPAVVEKKAAAVKLPKTGEARIEALRKAGVDVSNLFAMRGADGKEHVASDRNGMLTILKDNDPIFDFIITQGTVPNSRLFRRWIMAQMFHMMTYMPYRSHEPVGVTQMIHDLGYEYQWKMLMDELNAQMKMSGRDQENFADRNRWFNVDVVVKMATDYLMELKKRVDALKTRKCKGIPYKRIGSRDIFVADLHHKLYAPLEMAIINIKRARNATQLYNATKKFNGIRIKMAHDTPQSRAWINAYKGAGAFFTMQNLIRFHNCVAFDDSGMCLDKSQSLAFMSAKACKYKNEGWRLLGVLKKMLDDNNIDIREKMEEWRKSK